MGPWYILAPPFLPSYLSQSFQPVLRGSYNKEMRAVKRRRGWHRARKLTEETKGRWKTHSPGKSLSWFLLS